MDQSRYYDTMPSPIGDLTLISDGTALTGLYINQGEPIVGRSLAIRDKKLLQHPREQLQRYFEGDLRAFDLPVAVGGTPFQRRVWRALCAIAYGETISYGELARRIGQPRASRAVGFANSRNPISIVVPCHRVLGADGSLTGYSGGLERKRWLLAHERKNPIQAAHSATAA